jgi:hypothetical protein
MRYTVCTLLKFNVYSTHLRYSTRGLNKLNITSTERYTRVCKCTQVVCWFVTITVCVKPAVIHTCAVMAFTNARTLRVLPDYVYYPVVAYATCALTQRLVYAYPVKTFPAIFCMRDIKATKHMLYVMHIL